MKKVLIWIEISLSLILILFLVRLILPSEVDDVSPEISCNEIKKYNPDILWIIPRYNNKSIAENKSWCEYILSLNKTLGLHGVTHEFNEFDRLKTQEYLEEGMKIFEECFGFKPTIFKAPQLEISKENKNLILKNNMKLKGKFNQLFHKVYHTNNSGNFPNIFIKFF